jgi:hypothetical protein
VEFRLKYSARSNYKHRESYRHRYHDTDMSLQRRHVKSELTAVLSMKCPLGQPKNNFVFFKDPILAEVVNGACPNIN